MAIESEVEVLKSVVSKLDASIDKIAQVSQDIGKILAVHEQRLDMLDKVSDMRSEEIKDIHSRITTQTREVVEKIDQLQSRLEHKMQAGAVSASEQHQTIQKEIQEELRSIAKTLDNDIKELNNRVDVLERWKWYVMGAVATAGFMLGHFGNFLK